MHIDFDTGAGRGRTFSAPLRLIRADTPAEVGPALDAIARAQTEGHWLAGLFGYELGYCLSDRLAPLLPPVREVPLILLGVFERCEPLRPAPPPAPGPLRRGLPGLTREAYGAAFARVMEYIRAGDVYQVNLTFALDLAGEDDPEALFAALAAAQPVRHGAYMNLGGPILLSRSPELFFEVDAGGIITTRPMKGTAARGANPEEDRAARDRLAASPKDRAENLMIVDLMRNDLSRICEIGSVRVPRLYEVETYPTLHQMTSTVRGRMLPGTTLPDILRALFPCGSVTGAPKIRAMEIIRELEPAPRGAYCGAIGWAAPGGEMSFNVAIRTLTWHAPDRIVLNVGGGLVHDSTVDSEYGEALTKSRFAAPD